ncbi:MAG: outer membrane protein assembly factor BamE [Alistipes senegalensis]|nr:outer membrane protein assembly factor BamE [Oxalobacter formigenes]MCM1280319.1 outer membrane protein assembly factor BamE [Alistipes senegalensis]
MPVSSGETAPQAPDTLSRNPGLDSAEATGVQKLLNIVTPYRINIQQGNFISREMLSRIQPGMTPEQVRFALGTPLLADIFHAGRWDYVFRLQKPNGQITNNRVIIYFEDNRVARIVSDPLPDETQYLETIAGPAPKKTAGNTKQTAAPSAEETGENTALLPVDTPSSEPDETIRTPDTAAHETDTAQEQPHEASSAVPAPRIAPQHRAAPHLPPASDTAPETAGPASPPVTAEPLPAPAVPEAPPRKTPIPQDTAVRHEPSRPAAMQAPAPAKAEPEPIREPAKKAAVTVQDREMPAEPEEDFRAAPNSAMQLHELMQPQ